MTRVPARISKISLSPDSAWPTTLLTTICLVASSNENTSSPGSIALIGFMPCVVHTRLEPRRHSYCAVTPARYLRSASGMPSFS